MYCIATCSRRERTRSATRGKSESQALSRSLHHGGMELQAGARLHLDRQRIQKPPTAEIAVLVRRDIGQRCGHIEHFIVRLRFAAACVEGPQSLFAVRLAQLPPALSRRACRVPEFERCLAGFERELRRHGSRECDAAHLVQAPGMGLLTATAMAAKALDGSRFRSAGNLVWWPGPSGKESSRAQDGPPVAV